MYCTHLAAVRPAYGQDQLVVIQVEMFPGTGRQQEEQLEALRPVCPQTAALRCRGVAAAAVVVTGVVLAGGRATA